MISIEERTIDCEQGSSDWFQARLGCVTSSRIAEVVAKRKPRSKEDKELVGQGLKKLPDLECRVKMRLELVGEMLTGKATENYVSRWMKEGKEKEPEARAKYEVRFDADVRQVGFIYHREISRAGFSPDGLVGSSGIVEFKCPKLETHLQYLYDDVIPEDYLPQIAWQLACCEDRQWVDFISFHPDLKAPYDIFHKRLERMDAVDAVIRGMEAEVVQFNSEVDGLLERIKSAIQ